MCGILGSISTDFRYRVEHVDVLSHRGPDDEGYFCENGITLGHRRLSILDLSQNGHQPMFTEDGRYVIVFNGEIYNHQDVRTRLRSIGYTFKSTSDTETLLYGYCQYGANILKHLNGIFSLAIYDRAEEQVFIARDQFGIKPLYYYDDEQIFAFSSEIKALKAIPDFDASLDITSFYYYLQMLYAPGEFTPFKKVRKLMPGHFLLYDVKSRSYITEQYFEVNFNPDTSKNETEWQEGLERKLQIAVQRQLLSDVPLGFFLSGGLDSSLIVSLARKALPGERLKCFTISSGKNMEKEGFSDDEAYARKVASHLKVDLEVIEADVNILADFDKMIYHLDEPQADPAPLNVYNICKGARKQGIKVLLGGTAGDDVFSGYRRHQAINLEKYFSLIPRPVASVLQAGVATLNPVHPTLRRIKKVAHEINQSKDERFAGYFTWLPDHHVMSLFSEESRQQLHGQLLPRAYWRQLLETLPPKTDDLNKLLYLELKTFLPDHNLNYTDKMSMAAGVEVRVPYLDLDLIAFASTMPVQMKMKGGMTKYLLRKVAEKYLPKDVIYRPKTGFGAPIRNWIKKDLKPLVEERLNETELTRQGIFDADAVQHLIKLNSQGKVDASYTVWSMLAIQSWIKQFVHS